MKSLVPYKKRVVVVTLVALAILVLLSLFQELLLIVTPGASHLTTLTVNGKQWGQSTCYIGAVEGSSRFNIADVKDLGINTYRIYGGMPRWEPQDDDGIYGYPTIDEIKANPNIINWAWWDNIMTHPPQGSDYWNFKLPRWQGSASTLFSSLQQLHIRTVITLRNRDDHYQPSWAPNPPMTSADWNEWWEHVFALVYWLNVRNHYAINDFEVHNEPDVYEQGWLGNESQYFTFVQYTHDAIDYVYRTYLPGQTYHVYAPSTPTVDPSGFANPSGSAWPDHALQSISYAFDSISIHDYDTNTAPYIEQVHSWMDAAGHANYPLWLTEWGSYKEKYGSILFNVHLLTNLISQSYPGKDYVYGSHIFSLYDFDTTFTGLISYNGERRAAYYAMRMGIRALQGCRPTYQTTASNETLQAITTMDTAKNIYLLITNQDPTHGYDVDANLSALRHSGDAIAWQFDATHMDTVVGNWILRNGHVIFSIPANSSTLIKILP